MEQSEHWYINTQPAFLSSECSKEREGQKEIQKDTERVCLVVGGVYRSVYSSSIQ